MLDKYLKLANRKNRIRQRVAGTKERPRLAVYRSNKHITAQIIDDSSSKTLVFASDNEIKKSGKKSDISFEVGSLIAEKSLKKNIKNIVFDRGGNIYHGRIKSLAEGARKQGLVF